MTHYRMHRTFFPDTTGGDHLYAGDYDNDTGQHLNYPRKVNNGLYHHMHSYRHGAGVAQPKGN